MSPGIRDQDTKGPEISSGITNQEMVLPDRMEISPGIKGQKMELPDRMVTPTPVKHATMDIK